MIFAKVQLGLSVTSAFLFCFVFADADSGDLPCVNATEQREKLPTLLQNKYKANIRVADLVNNFTADIVNVGEKKQTSGLIKYAQGGREYQWIFQGLQSVVYIEDRGKQCNVSTNGSIAGNPISNISLDILKEFGINKKWRGLLDLLESASESDAHWINNSTGENSYGGVFSVENWVGCKNNGNKTKFLEFDVSFTKKGTATVDFKAGQIPVRIEVKIYDIQTTFSHEVFDVFFVRSGYSVEDAERYHLPPRGVYCDGWNVSRSFPDISKQFDVSIEYRSSLQKRIDTIPLSYDWNQRVIAFSTSGQKADVGFTKGLNLSAQSGRFRVIHDYLYGYEYVLGDGGDKCFKVSAIPNNAGDSAPGGKEGRLIALRNPTDLLLGEMSLKFSFVGERTLERGIPAHVYSARNKTASAVYEAWFTVSNWTVSTVFSDFNKSTLLLLDIYHRGKNGSVTKTSQRFHGFADLNGTSFPMAQTDVTPCLRKTKYSYLYFELKGKTMDEIDKFGRERVKSGLREKLATLANVSVVRISDFYIEDEVKGSEKARNLRVFFILGEKNDVKPAATLNWRKEISAAEGWKNLKESMKKDNLVTITDFRRQPFELTIVENSLGQVPETGGEIIEKTGYSGGSMAALGICMLLIGAVLGLAAAFYFWKRSRGGGGFAYQVYE